MVIPDCLMKSSFCKKENYATVLNSLYCFYFSTNNTCNSPRLQVPPGSSDSRRMLLFNYCAIPETSQEFPVLSMTLMINDTKDI